MNKNSKIIITGAGGLVGSNLKQFLQNEGYSSVMGLTRKDCDLTDLNETISFFKKEKPDYVFHIAGFVFGIMGNMKQQAKSYLMNTLINTHVVEACYQSEVKKVVAMGSGCVYPYPSPGLPLKEKMVWQGEPHDSEMAYAHSKRSMLAQLEAYKDSYDMDYAFVISGNLFGPNDKFDENFGHVVPSLVSKFHKAAHSESNVVVWGDGSAQRDFLYVEDVARALEVIMLKISGAVNMGSGKVICIKDIVHELAEITGTQDRIVWDSSKPNGQDYRAYNLDKLFQAGFEPKFTLKEGLEKTVRWFSENINSVRR